MNEKCLNYLQKQLKNKQMAKHYADERGDSIAAANLVEKIAVLEHLIALVEQNAESESNEAEWIYDGSVDGDGNLEANCSRCMAGDVHRPDLRHAVPFCWKCGARMKYLTGGRS